MEKISAPQRIQWIDFAKGFVMILVVVGHTLTKESGLNNFFSMFRMPFFFVMAGYLLNVEKWSGIKWQEFKIKLERRLMLPYFIANFAWYPIWFIVCYCFGFIEKHTFIEGEPLRLFISIFVGINDSFRTLPILGYLWFLPCLFFAEIIYMKLCRYFDNDKVLLVEISFLLGVAGYFFGLFLQLPLAFDTALVAQFFILIGNFVRKYNLTGKLNFGVCMVLLALVTLSFLSNKFVDMNGRDYGNLILFYFGGISGSLLVIKISMILANFSNKIFDLIKYCGVQSLAILILHMPILDIVHHVIKTIGEYNIDNLPSEYNIFLIIFGVIIPVLIAKKFGDKPVIKYFCS